MRPSASGAIHRPGVRPATSHLLETPRAPLALPAHEPDTALHSTLLDDENDLIFPSVMHAADVLDEPVATDYMYTSPHRGADVRLYVADAATGPRNHGTVPGEQNASADHVSSPHAIGIESARELDMRFFDPLNSRPNKPPVPAARRRQPRKSL